MGSGLHSLAQGPSTGSPVPSTSWGASRTSHPLPQGRGPCPAGFPILLPRMARPRLREGTLLSCGRASTAPHGGQPRPGAWQAALPQEPKKVSSGHWGAGLGHEACDGAAAQQLNLRPVQRPVRPGGGAVLPAIAGTGGLTCPSSPHTCTQRSAPQRPGFWGNQPACRNGRTRPFAYLRFG